MRRPSAVKRRSPSQVLRCLGALWRGAFHVISKLSGEAGGLEPGQPAPASYPLTLAALAVAVIGAAFSYWLWQHFLWDMRYHAGG